MSAENSSSTALLFWLLVVILEKARDSLESRNSKNFVFIERSNVATKLNESFYKILSIYTFSASLVPHIKFPRNSKNRF